MNDDQRHKDALAAYRIRKVFGWLTLFTSALVCAFAIWTAEWAWDLVWEQSATIAVFLLPLLFLAFSVALLSIAESFFDRRKAGLSDGEHPPGER